MRKAFIITISILIITGGIFLIFYNKEKLESVSLYTVKEDYQRVITEGENLSIIVYLSEYETFLSDTDYIESSHLKSTGDETVVDISNIRYLDYYETYNEIKYYAYSYDLNFDNIRIQNYQMDLLECILEIRYLNQKIIQLELGNLYLLFSSISEDSLLSNERMFGIYNESDFEYISGLYILIDNYSNLPIEIIDIYTNNPDITLDLNETIKLEEAPSYNLGISDLLDKPYSSIGVVNNTIELPLDKLNNLLIPIKYKEYVKPINRLPIFIDYRFNNQIYTHIIDDIKYHSKQIGLNNNYGLAREYIYYY